MPIIIKDRAGRVQAFPPPKPPSCMEMQEADEAGVLRGIRSRACSMEKMSYFYRGILSELKNIYRLSLMYLILTRCHNDMKK